MKEMLKDYTNQITAIEIRIEYLKNQLKTPMPEKELILMHRRIDTLREERLELLDSLRQIADYLEPAEDPFDLSGGLSA